MRLKFNDIAESGLTRVQILKATTIYDPRYGEVTITKAMLDEMVKNFDEKVRGIEIMLDAGHNSDKESYGWFKNLEVKLGEDDMWELWGTVELTPMGQRALTEKHYGYISADFETGYCDNETLINHGTVLLGAALTNRPVVKRMKPAVQLSEKKMDLEKLLQACSVSSPEELIKMISDLRGSTQNVESEKTAMAAELSELKGQIALAEKENKFNVMLSEGNACVAQKDAYMKGDMEEFAKNAQKVKLSTVTVTDNGDADEMASLKVMKLAEEKKKSDSKLSTVKAISMVLSENPDLNKQYLKETRGEE